MPPHGFRSALAALVLTGALAPAASAGGDGFPVPSCGWASARLVSSTIGDPVRAMKPAWRTQIAPVLTCGYVERSPRLQLGNVLLVVVQFREQQFLRPPKGAVSVSSLGSCVTRVSCPAPRRPAWLFALRSFGLPSASAYAVRFVKLEALEVEDGFNQITIVVDDPQGPLPVKDETRALERLAKKLLPRFYWAHPSTS